ncbi:MAG: hypothetical protein IJF76_01165 [Clostridia bacterium]|nr:hypothetical protein [Clostridia bacterium]
MNATINHETYGQIVYNESFWTGKKTLMVNGKNLTKIDKQTFSYSNEGQSKYFVLDGNFLKGVFLTIDKEKIQLVPPLKWYEIFLPVIVFVALLVWANSPTLVLIFPLVGGAIGGLIGGIGTLSSVLAMKSIKSIPHKFLAWLGISILTVLVNFLVTTLIIATLV